ncbi:MAG TPA: hypothetical protein VG318_06145 [Actinomycetota bacterium]|nr:hypothetical protein [Actinomycetota bacterium]
MRLGVLDDGHSGRPRLLIAIMGGRISDVLKTMMYRPKFFGRTFAQVVHQVMRGPSPWSAGERELFAAYTSRLNQCPF